MEGMKVGAFIPSTCGHPLCFRESAWPDGTRSDASARDGLSGREARTELIAPASDRFVADDNPALEQQFFDITQAELKPEIPAYRATDDRRRKAMTVVKRFCILHHPILLDHLCNVTVPCAVILAVSNSKQGRNLRQRCHHFPSGDGNSALACCSAAK